MQEYIQIIKKKIRVFTIIIIFTYISLFYKTNPTFFLNFGFSLKKIKI